jgi:hypothetical protein
MAICRDLLGRPGCATRLMLHKSANVASITNRRTALAGLGDLIKAPTQDLHKTGRSLTTEVTAYNALDGSLYSRVLPQLCKLEDLGIPVLGQCPRTTSAHPHCGTVVAVRIPER